MFSVAADISTDVLDLLHAMKLKTKGEHDEETKSSKTRSEVAKSI